jgi:catechol 2,3-dioxygenase-like lactoylglutathione lyase family enzyme
MGSERMIAYSTLGTNDMDRSIAFYDAVFGALGATREVTTPDMDAIWTGQ